LASVAKDEIFTGMCAQPFQPFSPHPLFEEYVRYKTRRQFFKRGASFLGTAGSTITASIYGNPWTIAVQLI
jgi:hypothetical protein